MLVSNFMNWLNVNEREMAFVMSVLIFGPRDMSMRHNCQETF